MLDDALTVNSHENSAFGIRLRELSRPTFSPHHPGAHPMTPDRGEAERCAPPVGMESGTWHWLEQDGDKPFPAYWTGGSWGISDRWAFPSQMTADGVRYPRPRPTV